MSGDGQAHSRGLALPVGAGLALMGVFGIGRGRRRAPALVLALTAAAGLLAAGTVRGTSWAIAALLALASLVLSLNSGLGASARSASTGRTGPSSRLGSPWRQSRSCAAGISARSCAIPAMRLPGAYAAIALASTGWSQTPSYTAANALGLVAYLGLAGFAAVRMREVRCLAHLDRRDLGPGGCGARRRDHRARHCLEPASDVEVSYRLEGFSGHPNALGQQAAVLCLLVVAARRVGVIGRSAFLVSLAIGLGALLASRSRFALAAFLASWAFVALRGRLAGRAVIAGAVVLGLVAGFLAVILPLSEIDGLFGGMSRTGNASEILTLTGRTDLWAAASELVSRAPLFGWVSPAPRGCWLTTYRGVRRCDG